MFQIFTKLIISEHRKLNLKPVFHIRVVMVVKIESQSFSTASLYHRYLIYTR
jgi:hypothetical protein